MKDFIAPITAMGMIFGGGIFLFLTLGVEGTRVESSHLVVSGLMGGAAQYLFGADIQQRANSAQPTVTTTRAHYFVELEIGDTPLQVLGVELVVKPTCP